MRLLRKHGLHARGPTCGRMHLVVTTIRKIRLINYCHLNLNQYYIFMLLVM